MRWHRAALGLVLATSGSPALAELSDKIPTLTGLWCWAAGFTLAALLLALWRPAAGLLALPLAVLWAWGGHDMVSDAHLGPAILAEQGSDYVSAVYASAAAGVIGPLLAVLAIALWRARVRGAA
ncbi:MAG TPA: hypothetical protein VI407_09110 [Erythrobacter sp.]